MRGRHWVESVKKNSSIELVALVDSSAEQLAKAADLGVPEDACMMDLDDAIERVDADFVLDITPPAVHHIIAEKAFGRGLHVLGEKPLSDNFGNARTTLQKGREAGVKHMITQNYRFGPPPRCVHRVIKEGIIGTPEQCDMRFYMDWADLPETHYVTEPYMLINDMMVHHFDLMRYVLDANPIAVQAITWNQSWGWHAGDAAHAIVFEFQGGLHATHVSCGCAVGSTTPWNGDWRIEGAGGSLDWVGDRIYHNHLHKTDTPVENNEIEIPDVPAPDQAILDEFVGAIREDRDPECSAGDNIHSLAMVFAAIRSAEEGRRVEIRELLDA
jgi:predicted dehydrogenase